MNKTTFDIDKNKLIVTRAFNAPLELVWKAWTDPQLLDRWWAPKPWKSETKRMDFKEGGYRLYAMVGPEGEKHWGRTDYASIVRPKSFAGEDSFCDEEGNLNTSLPAAQFANVFAEKQGRTEVVITTAYASESDLKTVLEMGMEEGLAGALDNLDNLLENLNDPAHPAIVSRDEWLAARKALLAKEKDLTRLRDRVNAQRRRLPMVRIEKDYAFDSPEGPKSLGDLFEGRRQLIVYHFMFDPQWDEGCPGCTFFADALGDLSMLQDRHTTMAFVSRAPLAKLEAYKAKRGWNLSWYSSFGSDFNYDFHVTLDESVAPLEYNYRNKTELEQRTDEPYFMSGESHGLSVFFRLGDEIFHTYSAYARGVEGLTDAYSLLDTTPYGRQEDFEDSPPGWPQKPTYGD